MPTKPTKKRTTTPLAKYHRVMNKAYESLSLAKIYADDGAALDAARCATEASAFFFQASSARRACFCDATEKA
jgi:hypothetical protein